MRVARSFLPVIVVAALVACDPGDDPGGPGADELVGTWVGPIDRTDVGMEASDTITMILGADGQFSTRTGSDFTFGTIDEGLWGVTGDVFVAAGNDAEGTTVEFSAPRSTTRLTGAWGAGEAAGNFEITKQ
jgi:hypothetical protein